MNDMKHFYINPMIELLLIGAESVFTISLDDEGQGMSMLFEELTGS